VAVERDTLGTATLRAQNRHDLVWALGYVHAQERFFEMDLMRRQPAGELAELFGSRVLPADREARKHRMRARASSMLKELPVEQRELLDAYRDGVNEGPMRWRQTPSPIFCWACSLWHGAAKTAYWSSGRCISR
jgi:penicillin amidase